MNITEYFKIYTPYFLKQHTTDLSTLAAEDAHLTKPNRRTASRRVLAEKLKISCFLSMSVFLGSLQTDENELRFSKL